MASKRTENLTGSGEIGKLSSTRQTRTPNTQESKPVYKLYAIIDELTECDTYFEMLEADCKTEQTLSAKQYDDIMGFCTTAFQLIKYGNKVATAVSACMRL